MTGPLDGVKVWDASWVGVGPLTARYLAEYGATVVRTESLRSVDVLRMAPPFKDGVPGVNRSQFFADYNASKLGLGVNLSTEGGKRVAHRLTAWADVVIEAFTPGVMDRLGLGYDRLRQLNPALIMISTSMNGQTGPRRHFAGFGTVLAAMSGFCELTGWPDRDPGSPYGAYTDFIAQRFAAAAVVAALEHRDRTGEGQYIDLSQMETALMFLAPELVDYQRTGRVATRDGNRSRGAAPHGVFPCLPEDGRERWVAIAVTSDAEWAALRRALGAPGWTADPRLGTLAGRKEQEDRLEAELAAWTRTRTAAEVVGALQPGVPTGPVHDARGLQADPQVAHRHYFRRHPHPVMGEMPYEGAQAELSLTPHRVTKAAPLLGEDNEEVLTALLGLSRAEVAELAASGTLEQVLD
ncbi:CaiB/BaiF CoA transferase family protein [Nonomuraea ferruginea]|uniref:CoA transferase n=1 Tax=Nonomuraea ferruginea TaxID=46174 RepID=A0ABT4T1H1_9ACTN|nr:CoA transferase [Nonomuraea ferruginea]MDA0643170.1 CoA transferase [Nonomuraea ferruginea]